MSSMAWMYHSHVNEPGDTNAGLFGFIIVTRKGMARSKTNLMPADIDNEQFAMFSILDENSALYRHDNDISDDEDEEEHEKNLKHTINGYLYCNGAPFTAPVGGITRFYVGTLGTEADVHAITWQRTTGVLQGHRREMVGLLPAAMAMVDIAPKYCSSG